MACPGKPTYLSWRDYCKAYPGCPGCTSSGKVITSAGDVPISIGGSSGGVGPVQYPADQLRLTLEGTWELIPEVERQAITAELVEFEAALPNQGLERNIALADFYAERGLELMHIHYLDMALPLAKGTTDLSIVTDLASALSRAGFYEAALATWDAVPQIMPLGNPDAAAILGDGEINRGRILQTLGRMGEADNAFSKARHLIRVSGRLTP